MALLNSSSSSSPSFRDEESVEDPSLQSAHGHKMESVEDPPLKVYNAEKIIVRGWWRTLPEHVQY